jgi:hypothetical protein
LFTNLEDELEIVQVVLLSPENLLNQPQSLRWFQAFRYNVNIVFNEFQAFRYNVNIVFNEFQAFRYNVNIMFNEFRLSATM